MGRQYHGSFDTPETASNAGVNGHSTGWATPYTLRRFAAYPLWRSIFRRDFGAGVGVCSLHVRHRQTVQPAAILVPHVALGLRPLPRLSGNGWDCVRGGGLGITDRPASTRGS
jgi:hypothetical protein